MDQEHINLAAQALLEQLEKPTSTNSEDEFTRTLEVINNGLQALAAKQGLGTFNLWGCTPAHTPPKDVHDRLGIYVEWS